MRFTGGSKRCTEHTCLYDLPIYMWSIEILKARTEDVLCLYAIDMFPDVQGTTSIYELKLSQVQETTPEEVERLYRQTLDELHKQFVRGLADCSFPPILPVSEG